MRAKVPAIVKDPEVSEYKEISPTEEITIEREELFLTGPMSPRVAVVDFVPGQDRLAPGVPFVLPDKPDGFGSFVLKKPIVPGMPFAPVRSEPVAPE